MKYGIHLSTYTKKWSEDVFQYIPVTKELEYDGVEFPLMDPDNFDAARARKMLFEYDLSCTCGTGLNEMRDISSLDKEKMKNGIRHLKKCIDICSELETDCLGGVLYAPWGQYMTREKAKENIETSLKNLSKIGDYAKEKGVVLALEMLNRYESYFLNTIDDGKKYLKQINNNNIKLHFDTFHANIEERSIEDAIIEGGSDIYHVHVCENDRGVPGSGHIDWKAIKEALVQIDYNRWITIENFVMPNCEVGENTFIWREIQDSGHHAAEEGIKFLKAMFG